MFHRRLYSLHLAVLSTNDMVLEELFWLNQDNFPTLAGHLDSDRAGR